MNIQFNLEDHWDKRCWVFHCKDFPDINFHIGDEIWIYDFAELLDPGWLYSPDVDFDISQYYSREEIYWGDSLHEIVSISHGMIETGYIKMITLKPI